MGKIRLFIFFLFSATYLLSQNIDISISPNIQTIIQGNSAHYKMTIDVDSGFTQQVLFDVIDTDIPSNDFSWSFDPTISISYPYSDSIILDINTFGSLDSGFYYIVVDAGNGPIITYDTCYLKVTKSDCKWYLRTPSGYDQYDNIIIDSLNNVWISITNQNYLKKYNGSYWETYVLPVGNIWGSIAADQSNNIWIASDHGLILFDGTVFTYYNTGNSQVPEDSLHSVAIDQNNNIWVGTLHNGLAKFDGTYWSIWDTNNSNIPSQLWVHNLKFDHNGHLWFLLWEDLIRFDGTFFTSYNNGGNISGISSFDFDSFNNLWLGAHSGLYKYDGINWKNWKGINEVPNHILYDSNFNIISSDNTSSYQNTYVPCVFIDPNSDDLWFTNGYISNYPCVIRQDGIYTNIFTSANSTLPENYGIYIANDLDGDLWFITNDGLGNWDVSEYSCNDLSVNLNSFLFDKKSIIFPNPAEHVININYPPEKVYSNIYNIAGILMISSDQKKINVSKLSSGLYIIELSSEKGELIDKQKLIIK